MNTSSGWATLLLFVFLSVGASASERPLNVLFIVADDLNTNIGCYGGKALTPHLDAFAKSGLLFSRAYCQEAVCGPR
jgi:iduronate 2-sulfatase